MKYFPLYSIAFAASLASTAYVFALMGGEDSATVLLAVQAVVLLMPGLSLFMKGYKRIDRKNLWLWATIFIILLSNLLVNIGNYSRVSATTSFVLAHMLGIVGMLFAIQWAVTNFSPETLMRHLAIFLFPLIALAIVVALQDGRWTDRAIPFGIHPNWWGELGFAFTVCALALRSWKAKSLLIGMAMILFFRVQSRGALLAACVSVGVYIFFSMKQKRQKTIGVMLAVTAIAFVVAIVALQQDAVLRTGTFLTTDVLLLNDPYRGVDESLNVRLGGWERALDAFAKNPIFGQGLDTLDRVHNGFLRLAGEGGLLLLVTILFMMGLAVYQSFKKRNYLAISIIFGYTVYAMTYPRMLNMNLASAVFYLCLFYWSRNSSRVDQRIHERAGKASSVIGDTRHLPGLDAGSAAGRN